MRRRVDNQVLLPNSDVSAEEQAILTRLLQQLELKQTRNMLRDSYYDGRRAINQVGTIIPPQYYKLAIVLGWSAKAVDTLADRCNLDGFVWPDGDLGSVGFQEVYDKNYFGTEINSAITQSLLHGVSFLINTVGDTSIGEPAGCIHVKDARNATGTWDARGRRLDNLLSVTSRDQSGSITGLALYLNDVTITAEKDDSGWSVDRTEHSWGVPAEPMVYRYRTGRPFGTSRISRSVMSLHDMALRTVIRMEGHADTYSFPEMWLMGADESIFKNADGTQKAVWQVMLGRIKAIPDDDEATNPRADVKQFSASSPQPHIDQLKQQAQLFSGETSIPLTSLGVSDMSNPTSADSYVASREDLIARAEAATDDYSRPLRRAMARALAMQNNLKEIPAEWSSIQPKWRSPIYLSRAQQADAGMKQVTAIPWLAETSLGLELLGLDDQQIQRAMSEKRRAQGALAAIQALQNAQNAALKQDQRVNDLTGSNQ
ncbi:phage portal protein [Mycobacterium sp. E1747]|uniref:phage portal protein n=1 Tax=Mycobacterium sp. E1747 TaxID=1834128 RepID=UPI003512E0A6